MGSTTPNCTASGLWGGKLALLCLLLLSTAPAFAGKEKLSRELRSQSQPQVDVIVQFRQTPNSKHLAKVTGKGGKLKHQLGLVNGAAFAGLPAGALAALADDPDVAYITPDRKVNGAADYSNQAVGADLAWQFYGVDGSGVGVAVIDSGINSVGDLNYSGSRSSRIVYSQNFASGANTTADLYGHGTHVAGIIGGNGASSTGSKYWYTIEGVAPNVKLINLRVLDQYGAGTDSQVINAIQTAIRLKDTYNIRVINLSLGRQVFESYRNDPLCQAVEAAWKAGIVVVVAAGNQGRNNSAGNQGYGTIASPANDPYVITVGAMRTMETPDRADDVMASYSSKGPTAYDHIAKPDLVAPGNMVMSLLARDSYLVNNFPENAVVASDYIETRKSYTSPYYFRLSGTSMAAPMVSGAAALMLQKDPSLSPDTVKARLMKSAFKALPALTSYTDPDTGVAYSIQSDLFTVGAGYLDVQAALANNDVVPALLNANSPTAVYNSLTRTTTLVNGTSVVWGVSLVWGNSVVWGSSVVWGNTVTWGSSVFWGSSGTSQGLSIIWGSSVIWGATKQNAAEATSIAVRGDR